MEQMATNLSSKRLFIFDLDGTVVDSSPTVVELLNQLRGELKLPSILVSDAYPYLSNGGKQLIEQFVSSREPVESLLTQFRMRYKEHPLDAEKLYGGVREFIERLQRANVKLAICSNKPTFLVKKVLEHHNLLGHFDLIIGASDVVDIKPNPEGLLKILTHANVAPREAVMIGDSRSDQQAAIQSNVAFFHHRAGYDDGVDRRKTSMQFNHYHELMRLFNE